MLFRSSGFATWLVHGRSRVPNPPASTTTCTTRPSVIVGQTLPFEGLVCPAKAKKVVKRSYGFRMMRKSMIYECKRMNIMSAACARALTCVLGLLLLAVPWTVVSAAGDSEDDPSVAITISPEQDYYDVFENESDRTRLV